MVSGFCNSCGCAFTRRKYYWKSSTGAVDAGRHCSRECYNRNKARIANEARALRRIAGNWVQPDPVVLLVAAEVAALKRIATWRAGMAITVRPCKHCGRKAKGRGERARACDGCAKEKMRIARRNCPSRRADKARRKAMDRGVLADRIDPIKVFERDKWMCHLCGCKTDARLRGSYLDNAPELDHVIPLSKGGTHTWGNVRCACRSCNGKKSNRLIGQLGFDMPA